MQNLTPHELISPVVVAAHDAGAANLIIGWLRDRCDLELRTCLGGPAIDLWTAAIGKPQILQAKNAIIGAKTLISGTSYISQIEHQVRDLAAVHNVHSIAVIDHWVNYSGRFSRNGQLILPNEIWVADEDALKLATMTFPEVPVKQKKNAYLADLVLKVLAEDHNPRKGEVQRVLYALEPIRNEWARGCKVGEFQALDYFIERATDLNLSEATKIRLRPHPSDPPGKYDAWMAEHHNWNIKIDPITNLAKSISWADTVVGCETYALVVGLAAGRCVISSLPPNAPKCRLPMQGIISLSELPSHNYLKEPL